VPLSEELRALAARVSNTGRWGADDQRGTLNLITPDAVKRGAGAVRDGRTFSLAMQFHAEGPQTGGVPGRVNPEIEVLAAGMSVTGDPGDFTTTDEVVRLGTQASTHWDALAHVGYDERLWNDTSLDVVTGAGAVRLGAEHLGSVVTRGVLLDVARTHGVDRLPGGYPITDTDLDAALAATGLGVEPGDIVLIRTGQPQTLRRDDPETDDPSTAPRLARQGDDDLYRTDTAGVGVAAIEWFARHDVAAVATDTFVFEVWPCEDPAVLLPVHMIDLRDVGLVQGQLWYLEDLADDCAADGRHEFLLSATPLPITGAAGAPVAPTAVK